MSALTHPRPVSAPDRLTVIWNQLPSADRLVLLGHDRDELTRTEKVRLTRLARAVVIASRDPREARDRSRTSRRRGRRPAA